MPLKDSEKLFATLNKLLLFYVFWSQVVATAATPVSNHHKQLMISLKKFYNLSPDQVESIQSILSKSKVIGTGSPNATYHPISKSQCLKKRSKGQVNQFIERQKLCGRKNMVPVDSDSHFKSKERGTCIDQYEFPNIPCEYPIVWATAQEAHLLCKALNKRLCDSHEWEQSCAGSPSPSKIFRTKEESTAAWHKRQRKSHNLNRDVVWATKTSKNHKICGFNSSKSPGCDRALSKKGGSVFKSCGSNTYPSGVFPKCHSPRGVFDQHGNVAEHMNLASKPSELTRNGGTGYTEMKGSWFIFAKIKAHKDDCHWRAPAWHLAKVNSKRSHHNYHLGFRCCATVKTTHRHKRP